MIWAAINVQRVGPYIKNAHRALYDEVVAPTQVLLCAQRPKDAHRALYDDMIAPTPDSSPSQGLMAFGATGTSVSYDALNEHQQRQHAPKYESFVRGSPDGSRWAARLSSQPT